MSALECVAGHDEEEQKVSVWMNSGYNCILSHTWDDLVHIPQGKV